MLNEPLMRAVVDRIIADPKSLDMSEWVKESACGTSACVAGFAILESECTIYANYLGRVFDVILPGSAALLTPQVAAANLLGLSTDDAYQMFHEYYWCTADNKPSQNSMCEEYTELLYHRLMTPREVIKNISAITGLEFKIPDDLL